MEDISIFNGLRERLDNLQWPLVYMFKFIVPVEKAEEIISIFGNENYTTRPSKTGKYISITSTKYVSSPEEVIDIYSQASKVDGVISL